MGTYGQVRQRIVQQAKPGTPLDAIDGFMMDRYQEILDALGWQRLTQKVSLWTAAEYSAGTLEATAGSTVVTGDGTAWDASMDGRMLRISAGNEYYMFTRVSDTLGSLDRPYEGTASGSGLSYRINQNVVSLQSAGSVRYVDDVAVLVAGTVLERKGREQMDAISPSRNGYGAPLFWTPYMDDSNNIAQIELWPVPMVETGLLVTAVADAGGLAKGDTSTAMLPFVREGALVAGVMADLERSPYWEARFNSLLADMVRSECIRAGTVAMRTHSAWTRHYARRWQR